MLFYNKINTTFSDQITILSNHLSHIKSQRNTICNNAPLCDLVIRYKQKYFEFTCNCRYITRPYLAMRFLLCLAKSGIMTHSNIID